MVVVQVMTEPPMMVSINFPTVGKGTQTISEFSYRFEPGTSLNVSLQMPAAVTVPVGGPGALTYRTEAGSRNVCTVTSQGALTLMPNADGMCEITAVAAETDHYKEATRTETVIELAQPENRKPAISGPTTARGGNQVRLWVRFDQSIGLLNIINIRVTNGTVNTDAANNNGPNYPILVTPLVNGPVTVTITAERSRPPRWSQSEPFTFMASGVSGTQIVRISKRDFTILEDGGTDTYTVRLHNSINLPGLPDGSTLTLPLTTNPSGVVSLEPTSLVFNSTNQRPGLTVQVTAIDNPRDDPGDETVVTISHGFTPSNMTEVTVRVTDDDVEMNNPPTANAGMGISVRPVPPLEFPLEFIESSMGTYEVRLTSRPTDLVTVTTGIASTGVATVEPKTLTFSNVNTDDNAWNKWQPVTVRGVDDAIDNDSPRMTTITHEASGADYNGVTASPVTVRTTDDDTEGVTLSTDMLTVEEGDTGTYTVRLNSQPAGNVTITPSIPTGDAATATVTVPMRDGMAQTDLLFTTTNWIIPQTVTVTGRTEDNIDSGTDSTTTITHTVMGGGYGDVSADPVAVTVTECMGMTTTATTIPLP